MEVAIIIIYYRSVQMIDLGKEVVAKLSMVGDRQLRDLEAVEVSTCSWRWVPH